MLPNQIPLAWRMEDVQKDIPEPLLKSPLEEKMVIQLIDVVMMVDVSMFLEFPWTIVGLCHIINSSAPVTMLTSMWKFAVSDLEMLGIF